MLLDDENVCIAIGDSSSSLSDLGFAKGATSVRHDHDLVLNEKRITLKRMSK